MIAQRCARDAATFIHPQLADIEHESAAGRFSPTRTLQSTGRASAVYRVLD
jgi:hypothetical protein